MIYATAIEIVDKANETKFAGISFFIILLFFVFVIHVFIIYEYIKFNQKKTQDLTFIHLQQEYKQQLERYLDNEDKEIAYLRHDIMNFIESQKGK